MTSGLLKYMVLMDERQGVSICVCIASQSSMCGQINRMTCEKRALYWLIINALSQ